MAIVLKFRFPSEMSMTVGPRCAPVFPSSARWLLAGALACTAGCDNAPVPPARSPAAADSPSTGETPTATLAASEPSNSSATPTIRLVDIANRCGLDYRWPMKPRPMTILDSIGSGCAAFDADDDGLQDILLLGHPRPVLYRNLGANRFEDVSTGSGLSEAEGIWMGCAVGDYDGDGRLDLLLTAFHQLALFRNRGGFRFEPVTAAAGLAPHNHDKWGSSAGFMDLDRDGWLDLVVLDYLEFGPGFQQLCEFKEGVKSGCSPREYTPERGELWRNTGRGSFELVPDSACMALSKGGGLVVSFFDVDDDGLVDMHLGNDGTPGDLMHNLGNWRFENIGVESGLAVSQSGKPMSSMAADWGDFDGDGRLDLTVTNYQNLGFALFRNLGEASFVDVADAVGLTGPTKPRLGFGGKWLDFENDGWPDLAFANGHVYDNAPDVEGPAVTYRQPLSLLHNERGARFVEITTQFGDDVQRPLVGRGSATADFNNDGLADLLVVDFEGQAMLLENRSERGGHWITLDLRGAAPNVYAYGARVSARAGERTWLADVSPATSYLSSSDPRIHWGLGSVEQLDSLTIRWPSGLVQVLNAVHTDRFLRLEEPHGDRPE